MSQSKDTRKYLVLSGRAIEADGILDFLRTRYDLTVARDLEEALAALRTGQFTAVLAETGDFLPLERNLATQQAAVVLETLGDAVCVAGPLGEVVWSNRRLKDFPPSLLEPLRQVCRRAFEHFSASEADERDPVRRCSLTLEEGACFEAICSPVRDRQGRLRQVAAVVSDCSFQRRQQNKLNAIDRVGRELVRLDVEALAQKDATQRLALIEERIIRYSREVLNYQHFAVLLLNDRTNRLEMLVSQGLSPAASRYELMASPEGNGICGFVAATGQSCICPNVRTDSRYLAGMEGAGSSLTVPLRLSDKVVGVLNVESDKAGAFGEEDRQFAEIFANYVALALHILNLLVLERRATHHRVSGSISAELTGPLNDIISEATEAIEDCAGQDELRSRLESIVEGARKMSETVQAWAQAAVTGIMTTPGRTAPDPLLAGRRILVADDEEIIRQTIRDVLTAAGAQADDARDGRQACEMVARNAYDLVISDIKMPHATGYEVFSAARAANPLAQVILITAFGYDPHHSIVKANREGLAAVLFKPFKVKQLLDECRQALSATSRGGKG
ncbi:MAG TPA: response regulator [Phycisphaerae bacterium]|nr:response regulator [Phycisphaerae bacterium]HQL76115.1 response regulator [Phycisphaerae bacterium]